MTEAAECLWQQGKGNSLLALSLNNSSKSAILVSHIMDFFASAIEVLQTLVIALGAGLGVWGLVNLLEGYGNDNPGANARVP